MELEVLSFKPAAGSDSKAVPLLFVHGAWHGAWCWQENFLPYFAEHGYSSHAVSLRGHGKSEGRKKLRWAKLTDYVADVDQVAGQLESPPVVIGHSMGGAVVQHYLKRHPARGAILLASVPPSGALRATLRYAAHHPLIYAKACLTLSLYPLVAKPDRVKEAFFSNGLPQEKIDRYASLVQDEAFRAYVDMIINLPRLKKLAETPFLVLGASNDFIISRKEIEATGKAYQAQTQIFEGRGHDVMLDQGWQEVADRMLAWLDEQKFN